MRRGSPPPADQVPDSPGPHFVKDRWGRPATDFVYFDKNPLPYPVHWATFASGKELLGLKDDSQWYCCGISPDGLYSFRRATPKQLDPHGEFMRNLMLSDQDRNAF